MKRFGTHLSSVLLIATTLGALSAHAGRIVCWTNDEGVRECGNAVPPQYAGKRVEVINERGMVVHVRPAAKTPEQLAEEQKQAALEQERQRVEQEKLHEDNILLQTFTTERDLLLARDSKVAAIESIIGITSSNVVTLEKDLQEQQRIAANYERRGKPIPEDVFTAMEGIKHRIAEKNAFIDHKRREQDLIRAKYQADLERFRELTAAGR